jgi:hypothetical protein
MPKVFHTPYFSRLGVNFCIFNKNVKNRPKTTFFDTKTAIFSYKLGLLAFNNTSYTPWKTLLKTFGAL